MAQQCGKEKYTVWKMRIFTATIFSEKFRESTYLFEYLIRVWKNSTKYDHPQKIREINSNFFSKNVDLTEKMLIFT